MEGAEVESKNINQGAMPLNNEGELGRVEQDKIWLQGTENTKIGIKQDRSLRYPVIACSGLVHTPQCQETQSPILLLYSAWC